MRPEVRMRSSAAAIAAVVAMGHMFGGGGRFRVVGKRQRPIDWVGPHQGAQEIARRRRQIERGQLTASNGLVQS